MTRGPCARNPQCSPQRPRAACRESPRALSHREPKPGTHPHEHAGPPCPTQRGTRVPCPPQLATGTAGTTHRRAHTTRIPHKPSGREETVRQPGDHLLSPEDTKRGVKPTAAEPAVSHNDPGRADLAQGDPIVKPDKARPRNTLQQRRRSGTPAGKASTCPAHAADTQQIWASLNGP